MCLLNNMTVLKISEEKSQGNTVEQIGCIKHLLQPLSEME
jgi:hypothetical protein